MPSAPGPPFRRARRLPGTASSGALAGLSSAPRIRSRGGLDPSPWWTPIDVGDPLRPLPTATGSRSPGRCTLRTRWPSPSSRVAGHPRLPKNPCCALGCGTVWLEKKWGCGGFGDSQPPQAGHGRPATRPMPHVMPARPGCRGALPNRASATPVLPGDVGAGRGPADLGRAATAARRTVTPGAASTPNASASAIVGSTRTVARVWPGRRRSRSRRSSQADVRCKAMALPRSAAAGSAPPSRPLRSPP